MDRLAALDTFVAVADQGGFAPAARHLGQSPPAVTRAIAALERHLGVSLFRRTTRSVALTDEGAALLRRAREMLAQWRDAEHEAVGVQSAPRGELHVTAPVLFGRLHVLPVVVDLLAGHDGLAARLLLVDRNIRLVEEGIDVAVRIGELRDSSLRSVAIGKVRQVLVAGPAYLARKGCPTEPKELADHDLVAGDVRSGVPWRFGTGSSPIQVVPRLTVNAVDAQLRRRRSRARHRQRPQLPGGGQPRGGKARPGTARPCAGAQAGASPLPGREVAHAVGSPVRRWHAGPGEERGLGLKELAQQDLVAHRRKKMTAEVAWI